VISIDEILDVAVAPAAVFAVLTRVERYCFWVPALKESIALPGAADGSAGSRFSVRFAGPMGMLQATGTVTGAEPPRSLTLEATGGVFRLTGACDLEPTPTGTRLHVLANAELLGMARFVEGMARDRLAAALPDGRVALQAAIEREAAAG